MVGTSQTRQLQGRAGSRPHSLCKGALVEEKGQLPAGASQGVGMGVPGDGPVSAEARGGEQQVRMGTPGGIPDTSSCRPRQRVAARSFSCSALL